MMKTNKILKIAAFVFSCMLFSISDTVYAQTSAPGTTSTTNPPSATVGDYYNQAQQTEKDKIEGSKGQDSGDNYGVGNAAGDAWDSAVDDVKNSEGFFETAGSILTFGAKLVINSVKNLSMYGQDIYEYTDPYTGETEQYVKTIFGGAVATSGNLKGCTPIPIAIADASSCIFCPLFAVLYAAAQDMAQLSFSNLGQPMAWVMLVGYALFIAFKVLTHVSSFTRQDAPSFINELLIQSFKVLLAFLFLMNPNQVYQYFISPVLGAGLEFGGAMLFQAQDAASQCLQIGVANDTALLPVSLYAKLDCFIRTVQTEIAVTQAIGSALMCAGRHAAAGKIAGFWDFNMVFQGLFIWAFAIMLSLAFAFYLVDAVVTLGLVCALMPFLIACWPFKITNKYSKTGIEMILNVFFTFVFVGIVISINMQLIGQAMNTSADIASKTSSSEASSSSSSGASSSGDSSTSGGLTALAQALSSDNLEDLKNLTDLGAGGFLILVFCCIFGFKFSNQSSTLANKMAGSAGIDIGAGIGGMAAKGAKNLADKATKPARKAVANKISDTASKAGTAVAARLGLGKYGGKTGARNGSNNGNGGGGNRRGGNNSGAGGGGNNSSAGGGGNNSSAGGGGNNGSGNDNGGTPPDNSNNE